MVFSFFKKPPEKMVAKPAAVFRPEQREAAAAHLDELAADARKDSCAHANSSESTDLTDFDFDKTLRDVQVDADIDPVDADVQQAAMLYADGHDDAARAVLEDAVRVHRYGPGERLWLMLFDLYLLTGQKAAFETLATEYARCFGQCSPGWRGASKEPVTSKTASKIVFRGGLLGENEAGFRQLQQAIENNSGLRLDLSEADSLDPAGCGRLLFQLQKAHKARRKVEMLGGGKLCEQLESRIQAGRAEDGDCWLLLLDLYQAQGEQQRFEDLAIDYAVTFEISPPSWDEAHVAASSLPQPAPATVVDDNEAAGTYSAAGQIKGVRFADLAAFVEVHDPVIIDCSKLARIDFLSAGALLNVLNTAKRAGKHIVFRHPNHLVAELFGMVGLGAVAEIVPAEF